MKHLRVSFHNYFDLTTRALYPDIRAHTVSYKRSHVVQYSSILDVIDSMKFTTYSISSVHYYSMYRLHLITVEKFQSIHHSDHTIVSAGKSLYDFALQCTPLFHTLLSLCPQIDGVEIAFLGTTWRGANPGTKLKRKQTLPYITVHFIKRYIWTSIKYTAKFWTMIDKNTPHDY